MTCKLSTFFIFISLLFASFSYATTVTAPVSGFARAFYTNEPVSNATITVLETGEQIRTDDKGLFGPFNYPVGKPITLILEAPGYTTVQSATIMVPPEGLNNAYNNITFQVPSVYVYSFFTYIFEYYFGVSEDQNSCHVTSTITSYHKTMNDVPQGEEGSIVTLSPTIDNLNPFYFDIVKSGPFKGTTYPFPTGLTSTSEDGGIMLFNVPARDKPYTLSASKDGVTFTSVQFTCRKGMFINISPPRGPMALQGKNSSYKLD